MAIVLKEEIKSEAGLIFLSLVLVFLLFFIGKNLITKTLPEVTWSEKILKEIKIDKKILEDEILQKMVPIESISPAPEIKRENPFIPY